MICQPGRIRTLYYWCLLFVSLVVLDDLTVGWVFWGIAQINPLLSTGVAFVISWFAGYWLTQRGLDPCPGRIASGLLRRLQLGHKSSALHVREQQLKQKITSVAMSAPMTLLFGSTIVTLWLVRRSVITLPQARRLGFWLSGLYAVEFALVHGLGIGGSIFFIRQ